MITSIEHIEPQSPGVSSHRIFHLENGNKIHAVCQDPYGFWSVHYDKGQVPENLKGALYTSLSEVEKAVRAYLSKKEEKKNA